MNCLVLKVSPVKGTTLFYIKNDKEEFTKELAPGSNMVECLKLKQLGGCYIVWQFVFTIITIKTLFMLFSRLLML